MPATYLRPSERRTGPPDASARWPTAGSNSGAGVSVERRVLLADVGHRGSIERPPERRQLRRDREAGDSEGRVRDPDKPAHRRIAEDGTSLGQAAQDAARELTGRPPRGGRCRARHDLVQLPGIDLRPGFDGGADGVAVAGTELDAPGDPCRGRAEPLERRLLAVETLRHPGRLFGRQPPPLPVPLVREREHGRVAALGQLTHLLGDRDTGPVAAEVHANGGRQVRPPDGGEQVADSTRIEVREQDELRQATKESSGVRANRPRAAVRRTRAAARPGNRNPSRPPSPRPDP
jgi:hypothetical protein